MWFLLAIAAVVAAAGGGPPRVTGFPLAIKKARPNVTQAGLHEELVEPEAEYTVSEENGWRVVELEDSEFKDLSWGWCFDELIKARLKANMTTESDLAQWFARWLGRRMDWVTAFLRIITLGLDACWRMTVPAIKLRFEGRDMYVVQRPAPAHPSVVDTTIGGWSPGSTRPGFRATVEPLREGNYMWVKYLGDPFEWERKYGLRPLVWHIVLWQQGATKYEVGSWKSFLAMSRSDWRKGFLVGEPPWQYDPLGPLGYFVHNSIDGEFDIRYSSHSKAMDRFK